MLRFVISEHYTPKDVKLYYIRNEYSLYSYHPLYVTSDYDFYMNDIDVGLYDEHWGGLAELGGLSGNWTPAAVAPPTDVLRRDLFLSKRSARKKVIVNRLGFHLSPSDSIRNDLPRLKEELVSHYDKAVWPVYFNSESGWGVIGDLEPAPHKIQTTDQIIVCLSEERMISAIWFRPIFVESFDEIERGR